MAARASDRGDARWQRAQLLGVSASTRRAQRLSLRLAGETPPEFSALAEIPEWTLANIDRDHLALACALICNRPLIDREISGQKLASLAEMVGPELFDQICDVELPASLTVDSSTGGLPPPHVLTDQGRALLDKARHKGRIGSEAQEVIKLTMTLIKQGAA